MTNDYATKVQEALDKLLEAKHDALPPDFNKTRFSENCKAYVVEYKEFENCDVDEVSQVLFKGAVLGLDFLAKECHAITEGSAVKFQTDYKGEMKLAKKYSVRSILEIYAKNVREGDAFREEVVEGKPGVFFNPLPFNNSKINGCFAVALFADGSMIYETMSSEEIETTRKHYGKRSTSETWEKSPGEMNKRTVLRRLCKMIDVDFDTEQRLAFESGSAFDYRKEIKSQQSSPLNDAAAGVEGESDATDQG